MKDPIKLLKMGWKTGMTAMVVLTMVLGGLALNLSAVLAQPAPNMTIRHEAIIGSGPWSHDVTLNPGDEVQFLAEIHNTVVGSTADNVHLAVNLTSGNFTDGTSVATVSANNASSAEDTVNIHINGGGQLEFIDHSTRVTWDVDGDGNKEFDNTHVTGNPLNGMLIGDQNGCNEYIIMVYWAARVVGGPVEPSPSPTPTPTPAPPCDDCGDEQEQEQEQNQDVDVDVDVNQENNQTVNITNPAPPAVAGVKVPLKQPETGVSVLGMSLMAGAAPVGYALSRFGRGRITAKKEDEETLGEFANGIVSGRGKSSDA